MANFTSNFIYQIPDIWLFILINMILILFSIFAVAIIERIFPAESRYKENQGIGYISATICVIFAVLAGFAALYVLNNFNKAGETTQEEANMAMAIYQDAGWLRDPLRSHLRNRIKAYYKLVIEHDWPLMIDGREVDMKTDLLISTLATDLHQDSHAAHPPFALQEINKEMIALRTARAERLRLSQSALGPDIWIVILLTAFMTTAINYAFGMQFQLHFVLASAVAVVISSMIFLLIVLDHPFQGKYSIGPTAFQYYLDLISEENAIKSE